jgi:UDP-glucose 4-epimerase
MLHGVGWLGDVKRVALRIEKLKMLGFKPNMKSRDAIRITTKKLLEESKDLQRRSPVTKNRWL